MDVWQWTPLIALIVLAGLASMPGQVLEAAKVDGATYLQRLRHIVLPMIAGVIVVALLIRSMDAIRYFDIITEHHQRRAGGRDQDRPDPALRDGLPLLRPRLRGGHRALDAGGVDPRRQPVPEDLTRGGWRNEGRPHRRARADRRDPAVDRRAAGVDGAVLAQAGRRADVEPADARLQADVPALLGPVQRRQRHRRLRRSTRSSPRASRRSSRWRSAAWPATGSRAASSAARTTSRSGSSRRAWRRSPRSCCRCS